jgi:cytochrome c oxidase subunit 3
MNPTRTAPSMSRISTGRIALFIVLGAESVFFVTVLVAYAALRDQVTWDLPHTFARLQIPLLNTTILLISAILAGLSTHAIRQGKRSSMQNRLMITLSLGLLFVAGQMYEFTHSGLHIDDASFGGVFFTLLGFHAVHVLAGVVFLILNLIRASLGDFTAVDYEPVQLGTWFWYYVTAVWAVLFTALYLI